MRKPSRRFKIALAASLLLAVVTLATAFSESWLRPLLYRVEWTHFGTSIYFEERSRWGNSRKSWGMWWIADGFPLDWGTDVWIHEEGPPAPWIERGLTFEEWWPPRSGKIIHHSGRPDGPPQNR